ncbi:MAG: flagellar filament outer layer protein FlaA [Treponema sp.]|nr:flagellar filament outer layer protein FlaA [Treponema sp.]
MMIAFLAMALVSADDQTTSLESIILESFDGDSGYDWKGDASRYATKTEDTQFPVVKTVDGVWPNSVFGTNPGGKDLKSLGIWGRFDRQGYNWMDVYPVAAGGDASDPTEIPIPGKAKTLDLWVWGANMDFYMELYVRDYQGIIHKIDMGSIRHVGWKNIKVTIPATIPQSKQTLPRLAGLTFVKFRVWTEPMAPVDNFYVYFDQFRVLTDTFESSYDGNELTTPDRIQQIWGDNQ